MPLYEYECLDCGHKFDRIGKMDEAPPPCPRLIGPGAANGSWAEWFAAAQRMFAKGRTICYPGSKEMVGPEFEHTVIHLDGLIAGSPRNRTETKTVAEWLEGLKPCGGETKRLISKSDFHLKGGGWAADGY
jgi:predicted nucleic acid-binding Zn ribbon protein